MIDHRLDGIHLSVGAHNSPEQGICIMEAVSMLAGEHFSDRPECVSPVIGTFLRNWNDGLADGDRQRLRPYALRVIGTVAEWEIELARAHLALDWLIRTHTVAWLRRAGSTAHADSLESLPPVNGRDSAERALPVIRAVRETAGVAAKEAAGVTAWETARAATWAAAGVAAREAAREPLREAVGVAAWEAAWAAAGLAAWIAAGVTLQPTVQILQASAFNLLDRMIALSPGIWTPPTELATAPAEEQIEVPA